MGAGWWRHCTRGGQDGELTSTWRALASELSWAYTDKIARKEICNRKEKSPEAEQVPFSLATQPRDPHW